MSDVFRLVSGEVESWERPEDKKNYTVWKHNESWRQNSNGVYRKLIQN